MRIQRQRNGAQSFTCEVGLFAVNGSKMVDYSTGAGTTFDWIEGFKYLRFYNSSNSQIGGTVTLGSTIVNGNYSYKINTNDVCSLTDTLYNNISSVKSISIDDSGCWVWKYKPFCKAGYVRAVVGSRRDGTRKKVLAHRLSYETFIGKIPKGMTIDHLCNNTSCVNPEHLEAVTLWENISRSKTSPTAVNARKTNCPKCNSEYTNKKTGGRYCKPCYIEYHREYNKNRAACARKLGML